MRALVDVTYIALVLAIKNVLALMYLVRLSIQLYDMTMNIPEETSLHGTIKALIISPVTRRAATWPLVLELKIFLCLRLLTCVCVIIIVTTAHTAATFAVVRTW